MKTGIQLITEERREQIEKHGWTLNHDLKHENGELIEAAIICASNYILYQKNDYANSIQFDVIEMSHWNLPVKYDGNILLNNYLLSPKERIHQLKVAGALIAAEIDRLLKLKELYDI